MKPLAKTAILIIASILLIATMPAALAKFLMPNNYSELEKVQFIQDIQLASLIFALLGAGTAIIILSRKIISIETENFENEKRWRFALEGCGDGIWDWNLETGELFYSSRYKEMLGFNEHEMGNTLKEWAERLHPDDSENAMGEIGKISRGEAQNCSFEHRTRCKNDDYRWLLTRGKAIRRTAEGKPLRITGTITDITERKLRDEHFIKSLKLESVSAFAGGIGNEFNNILTAVIGYTSLARMLRDTPEKVLAALEKAEEAAYRAAKLTRQILFFAKDGTQLKQTVSAASLLHESISQALRDSKITCDASIPEFLNIKVDKEQMELAFGNIILNSSQAMIAEGKIRLKGEAYTLADNNRYKLPSGEYLKLSISDQGIGIPPENIEKVFDPYFTTKSGCTGLGLTSAYAIIREHGGTIDVHSATGSGTTFSVYLPLTKEKINLPEMTVYKQTYQQNDRGYILVMDDEEIIRNLSSELLGHMGYQVFTCCNGDEAIEMYRTAKELNKPFSIVIMDLSIPGGMGGKEAARSILSFDPTARLIVSSGYCNDQVMAEYEKYGFIAAVSKPYTAEKIIKTLKRLDSGNHADTP